MRATGAIAALLSRAAAACIRRRHGEWARALLAEDQSLEGRPGRLLWAVDALRGAVVVTLPRFVYPLILAGASGALAAYQWSRDEDVFTLVLLLGLSLCLGIVRLRRTRASAVALGAVVAGIHVFETVSGVRPAYETHVHGLLHGLRWLILMIPAAAAAALGGRIGQPAARGPRGVS